MHSSLVLGGRSVFHWRSRRGLASTLSSSLCTSGGTIGCHIEAFYPSSFTSSLAPWTALSTSTRGLKNLHQYPHARYKSLVKDHIRFSRNWWLTAGNNYELVEDVGHEREASENFGEYRNDSDNDTYVLSTSRLSDLPPHSRLDALREIMRKRWLVKDANRGFDKAKLLLMSLECYSEMRLADTLPEFDALPEPDQDTFLQYVEGCSQFAQACSHSHPEAVAILIRAAQICEEMRCSSKREEMLSVAERACDGMGRALYFQRQAEKKPTLQPSLAHFGSSSSSGRSSPFLSTLLPPSRTEMETERRTKQELSMQKRFKGTPWAIEKTNKVLGTFVTARNRTQLLMPMKEKDPRLRILQEPDHPETHGCSGKPLIH